MKKPVLEIAVHEVCFGGSFSQDPYIADGYALYINGNKTSYGYFESLKALREFWNKYRTILLEGYCQTDSITFKKLLPNPLIK